MFHLYWLLVCMVYVGVYGNFTTQNMEITTKKPDHYTTVIFGTNANNVLVLVSLLSDDGHLIVERRGDEVIDVHSTNSNWKPDPKYIICNEVQSESIPKCLSDLQKPFRFVVAFDATDMFMDPFWKMIDYLATYISADKVYSNQLQMVAMNVPHDGTPLQQHCNDLKSAIKNGLRSLDATDFRVTAMHIIEKSGPLSEMTELRAELADIKNTVDQ